MKDEEKVLQIIKNKGILKAEDLTSEKINTVVLTRLVRIRKDIIERSARETLY